MGCSPERVYEALHAGGIGMRSSDYYPKPPEVAERVVSLYLAGWSVKEIASELELQARHVSELVVEGALAAAEACSAR